MQSIGVFGAIRHLFHYDALACKVFWSPNVLYSSVHHEFGNMAVLTTTCADPAMARGRRQVQTYMYNVQSTSQGSNMQKWYYDPLV